MLKKTSWVIIFILVALFFAAPSLLGFSLLKIGDAVKVSTSMSAKLACSASFISGFDERRIVNDLATYSPVNRLVNLTYSSSQVSATLFGIAKTTATYRDGLGCTLDIGDTKPLDKINVTQLKPSPAQWPLGESVTHINAFMQQQLDEMLKSDNKQGLDSRAMLIVKNGHVIAESYGNNISAHTPLLGWSMGKSVTSIILGRMQQLGLLKMSDTHLFAQWNDKRNQLSLIDLLQMSSGLKFDETYTPGSDSTQMLFSAYSASDVAMASPLVYKLGQYFSYSSGTTNLLSRYIHQQLGNQTQTDINFYQQQLYKPLGMTNTVFEVDPSGVFVGSSYIYASGRDWARLGLLMLNKGEINHHKLLSKNWVKAVSTPNRSKNDKRYGYQFWLNAGEKQLRWPSLPKDAYAMLGNRKQSVMIIPSEKVVFVRIGWTKGEYPLDHNYQQLLTKIKLAQL
ncbi:MAG: serine hydrolase [Alteromonadaceae bacterium]|nr:serine hydrolase [Alteromonadaceae bacterium]